MWKPSVGWMGEQKAAHRHPSSVKIAVELEPPERTPASLVRRVRRSPDMQVAQIPQRRPVVIAHPTRKVRLVQPLVTRRFRHILQHAQPLLNRLPAFRRHLLPSRQHFVAHVVALRRGHLLPDSRPLAKLLLLLWRKLPESSLVLLESPPFFRRVFTRTTRIRRTVPIEIRPLHRLPAAIWRAIPSAARVPVSPRSVSRGGIARRIAIPALR